MKERLSEQSAKKSKKKIVNQTIRLLNDEQKMFVRWLAEKGINFSKFTRALWESTPEYKDFLAIKDKKWLEEQIRK